MASILTRLARAWGYFDGANSSNTVTDDRPNPILGSFDSIVPDHTWDDLCAHAQYLYDNYPPLTAAIDNIASWSVGRAFQPIFTGVDKEFGDEATRILIEQVYPLADVEGDFTSCLILDSISLDVTGDSFCLLTATESGYPLTQRIASYRIRCLSAPDGEKLTRGPYIGLRCNKGVITNAMGRTVAYVIMGERATGEDEQYVSARNMIHMYDPSHFGQRRGITPLKGAINDLYTVRDTSRYQSDYIRNSSKLQFVEETLTGLPDANDIAAQLTATNEAGRTRTTQVIDSGRTHRYVQAGTGSKITPVETARPGDQWHLFTDRMLRQAFCSLRYPFEIAWSMKELGGVNSRVILAILDRLLADRREVLRASARRQVQYHVAKLQKIGSLPPTDEWWKWDFTYPASMTADLLKDTVADLKLMESGGMNLEEMLAKRGRTLDVAWRERCRGIKRRQEIAQEEGVNPNDPELLLADPAPAPAAPMEGRTTPSTAVANK